MNRTRPVAPVLSPRIDSDNRRRTISFYIAAASLFWIALYLYVPTLPVYAQAKTDSLAIVGLILAMYGLFQGIVRLPLGIAADWLGWLKPFILAGFALAAVGAWVMGVAPDTNWLIAGRAITGLAAATWVPLLVVFSNLFAPEEAVRAVTLLNLTAFGGPVLATAVTGTINRLGGYPLSFFLAAGIAVLALVVLLPIRERRRPSQRPSMTDIACLVTRRDVLLPSFLNAAGQYVLWATTLGFIPVLARQLGATDVIISALTSICLGALTVGNFLTTVMVNRVDARRLVYLSFFLLALGLGVVALVPTLLSVLTAQLCIGFGTGIGFPVLMGMSIEQVEHSERATAMGLHQAVYSLGMFAGPGLGGLLAEVMGIRAMFALIGCFALIVGLLGTRGLLTSPESQQTA